MPAKREADVRNEDFLEIYGDYIDAKAEEQASRCSQCGVPFCQNHCPLQNNIPDWLKLTAEGRTEEAWEVSNATNNMPEICGRICPQDRLCEGSCVIEQSGHGTVTIGSVERFSNRHSLARRLDTAPRTKGRTRLICRDHRRRPCWPRNSGTAARARLASHSL